MKSTNRETKQNKIKLKQASYHTITEADFSGGKLTWRKLKVGKLVGLNFPR